MLKALLPLVLVASIACAHRDDGSNSHESVRSLGREVTELVESAKNPHGLEDPNSVRSRTHVEVVKLRERLDKIRQRTNTNVQAEAGSNKDPSDKQADERAKLQAELDHIENQLNAIDKVEEAPPAAE